MRKVSIAAILTAVALGAVPAVPAGAGGGGGCFQPVSDGSGISVDIKDYCYTPTVIHVEKGTEVTWTNREGAPHTVSGAGKGWGKFRDLGKNDTISFTFETNGVYPYYCAYHLGMVGAVVVGDGSGPGAAKPGNQDVTAALPPADFGMESDVSAEEQTVAAEPAKAVESTESPASTLMIGAVIVLVLMGAFLVARGARRARLHGSQAS